MLKTKRSGGPKTAAGKQACAQNALKTGAYAQALILPGESEQEFEQLHAQLVQDYAPQGSIEANLVYQLAKQIWKKMRLEHMEHAAMLRIYNRPLNESDIMNGDFKVGTGCLWLLNDFSMLTPELLDECPKYLSAYRDHKEGESTLTIEYLFAYLPELHFLGMERAGEMLGLPGHLISDDELETLQVTDPNNKYSKIVLLDYLFEYLKDKSKQVMRVEHYLEQCQRSVSTVRQKRLLNFMSDNKTGHAQQDLSREFYKILSELRRQHQWRLDHPRLEVQPNAAANTKAMH